MLQRRLVNSYHYMPRIDNFINYRISPSFLNNGSHSLQADCVLNIVFLPNSRKKIGRLPFWRPAMKTGWQAQLRSLSHSWKRLHWRPALMSLVWRYLWQCANVFILTCNYIDKMPCTGLVQHSFLHFSVDIGYKFRLNDVSSNELDMHKSRMHSKACELNLICKWNYYACKCKDFNFVRMRRLELWCTHNPQ